MNHIRINQMHQLKQKPPHMLTYPRLHRPGTPKPPSDPQEDVKAYSINTFYLQENYFYAVWPQSVIGIMLNKLINAPQTCLRQPLLGQRSNLRLLHWLCWQSELLYSILPYSDLPRCLIFQPLSPQRANETVNTRFTAGDKGERDTGHRHLSFPPLPLPAHTSWTS